MVNCNSIDSMELDAKTKLCRYCYLGRFEPVYLHQRGSIAVSTYWPLLQELCKALDDVAVLLILKQALQESPLVRRDETLFVYAAYLASDVDIKWKTSLRKVFPMLIQNDMDLFMFCKYATLIQHERKHKGFSKTVRKAITSWYEHQTPEALRILWLNHRGAYGYTHRALIKLCHINDETIGAVGAVTPFFKTCTELLKHAEADEVSQPAVSANSMTNHVDAAPKLTSQTASKCATTATADLAEKTQSTAEISPSPVVSVSKLRTTKNKVEALKIIRNFKLHYSQVPGHLLRYSPIMEALVPTMSYLQLLKCWRNMARYNHFDNPKVMALCKALLDNKKLLRKDNIHPIVFLMQLRKMGVRNDLDKLSPKKVESLRMPYLKQLYAQSFGGNQGTSLRMHITINLQANYRKKFLKNHKELNFYEAAITLAFGYFKKESLAEVYHWIEDADNLTQIPWGKEMDIEAAIRYCDGVKNAKNKQLLTTPISHAMDRKQVYDMFLVIVPTAGRGNPDQSSKTLSALLDKYREKRNPKAKFIILDLLKFKKSMRYSETRNENILEICGLDEHTIGLINNFALNRFG